MKEEQLLKISELARASGVSVTTLRFYVKEGLIRPARKTGRNMAYYDAACAATVKAIRTLQKERFYPLSVIKRLLETTPPDSVELELLDAIHKVDYQSPGAPVPVSEAVRRSRLTAQQISALQEAGLVTPRQDGRKKAFAEEDLRVMALVRRRLDAGIPFAQSVRSFSVYEAALREAVRADVDAFAAALLTPDFTAEEGAQRIRTSDETLDAFVALRRKALNRAFGSRQLEDMDRFSAALEGALSALPPMLREAGLPAEAAQCAAVLAEQSTGLPALDEAARHYRILTNREDLAGRIAKIGQSRAYFQSLSDDGLTALCLQVLFLTLAPPVLACGDAAEEARSRLRDGLQTRLGSAARALLGEIDGMLSRAGGTT